MKQDVIEAAAKEPIASQNANVYDWLLFVVRSFGSLFIGCQSFSFWSTDGKHVCVALPIR